METPDTASVDATGAGEGTSMEVTTPVAPKPTRARKAKTPTTGEETAETPEDGVEVTSFGFTIETF